MEEKKKKIMIVAIAVVALLLVMGTTFAYFVAQGGTGTSKNVTVTTDTTDSLTFTVSKALSITADQTSFAEGKGNAKDETIASAKLIAGTNRTPSYDYYMYLDIETNEFSYTTADKTAELILTILDSDDNPVTTIEGLDYVTVKGTSGFDVTEKTGLIEILNHTITTSGTKVEDWNVTLTLVNLDSDQNGNAGKEFTGELKLQKEKIKTIAEHIKDLYTTNGENNLYLHDNSLENGAEDGSYRYAGAYAETNNYLCFGSDSEICENDNLYRIIGVFGDQVKLIKKDFANSDMLGTDGDYCTNTYNQNSYPTYSGNHETINTYYWNYKANNASSNNWETSLLNQTNLNTNYITYLNKQNPKWTKMIADTNWNIGGYSPADAVAKIFYDAEKTKRTSTLSKIALMSASDYGYATLPSNWSLGLGSYNYATVIRNNWLRIGLYEWWLTANDSNSIYYLDPNIILKTAEPNNGYGVRPVFYLNSTVMYVSGDGTQATPFRIN